MTAATSGDLCTISKEEGLIMVRDVRSKVRVALLWLSLLPGSDSPAAPDESAESPSDRIAQAPAAGGQPSEPPRDPEWSQTVDGLQFRLKAPRSEFESW